eukprot:COSAG01_NODE_42612_length_438_cov_0.887906_2_plen_94_part_01
MLIISSSLNLKSKSLLMAEHARSLYLALCSDITFIDLKDYDLPLCDGGACYGHKSVQVLQEKIVQADGVLIATPVYNYDVNSALKALLECTGKA